MSSFKYKQYIVETKKNMSITGFIRQIDKYIFFYGVPYQFFKEIYMKYIVYVLNIYI
jgi:hypothetical protein